MNKIKTFDCIEIAVGNNRIVIKESTDGWDIDIHEYGDKDLRIGLKDKEGTYYKYFKDIEEGK
jgi:hypothetical protein